MAANIDPEQPPTQNLGGMITEKVMEGIKNLDLGQFMEKLASAEPENPEEEEARVKLQELLQKFTSMSSDEKEQFTSRIKDVVASKMSERMQDKLSGLEESIGEAIMYRLYAVAAVAVLVIVLFVFFGYKLYKSIKDKEVKREEKKKLKQMKKRK